MNPETLKDVLSDVARRARKNTFCSETYANGVTGSLFCNFVAFSTLSLLQLTRICLSVIERTIASFVVACLGEGTDYKRKFMLAALDAGYLNSEFVYVIVAPNSKGFTLAADGLSRSVWEDTNTPGDGRNHDALLAFKTVMIVSSYPAQYDDNAKNFSEQVLARMKDPPFFCTTACQGTQKSVTLTKLYTNENNLWSASGGVRPLAIPKCGFDGKQCLSTFAATYLVYVIIGAVIIIFCIFMCIAGISYSILNKRAETTRLNQMWMISFISLTNIATKNERVAARKHAVKVRFTKKDAAFFRKMRQIENDNVNRFVGICSDGPLMLSVWRYSTRGSVNDILMKSLINMDGFFIFSLINDIVNGIFFIHHSFIRYHGYLTAKCCLVDDRWQVKISDYGIEKLRIYDERSLCDFLWTAPEILRDSTSGGSQEGDIYSFGIICAQIVTQSSAWDLENRKEKEDELIYMIKKGNHNAPRPNLEDHKVMDISPELLHMIRDCWSEKPSERPPIKVVKTNMRVMNTSKSKNLMDHVFAKLESYALTLESEVAERTKELIEEKKKSDILLNRMLPRQIAEKLKLGRSVEPEMYERATVFFSDVVSFTTIAARGSPLNVIDLLNNLYTLFDGIIDRHDVYKVETIGDAYLCVSGVPIRNGNEHVKEICSMSLELMESLAGFQIPYLPEEKINLRIGIHTGRYFFSFDRSSVKIKQAVLFSISLMNSALRLLSRY
ncbi:hypothetical protein KIN20_024713 [Parelaphostrongylus tenuis]|uniref:guanylate cyclase n=1 Tax=Parelaphostrongylus tenuis TaxID=148309 RepID=A0AAD5NA71_PARTN|nr:hypothetical protein KIN20_024713 [Parelaphostrongylus tenuis]